MLQPSLSGDARISVICTLNPDVSAVAESTSTLLFAQRIKKVQLNAKKKEVVDTDALLERYQESAHREREGSGGTREEPPPVRTRGKFPMSPPEAQLTVRSNLTRARR